MACTMLTRIFHRARFSRRGQAPASTALTNKDLTPKLTTEQSMRIDNSSSDMETTMKPDPLVSVMIMMVPSWLPQHDIEAFVRSVPAIVQVRRRKSLYRSNYCDLIFDFEGGTDVYQALRVPVTEPDIVIDHHNFIVYPFAGHNILHGAERDIEVVSKSKLLPLSPNAPTGAACLRGLKLKNVTSGKADCYICFNEITGPFSTPCWNCRRAECYECIKTHFRSALKHCQQFPARCCEVALHPDVAKGVLPDDELAKYKARFEEWITQQPLYCPVPSCSAFIPPRTVKHAVNNQLDCHACNTTICVLCKRRSHNGRPCGGPQNEVADMLKNFGYKQCPKCGIAVGKMFGCSHVQCRCGAHWCWNCLRKIDVCNMYPCDQTENTDTPYWNEDRESDIESVNDSDEGHAYAIIRSTHDNDITEARDLDNSGRSAYILPPGDIALIESAVPTPTVMTRPTTEASNHNTTESADKLTNAELVTASTTELPIYPVLTNTTTTAATQTDPADRPVNLDDPNLKNWEHEDYDFGSEPYDEDPSNMWGCIHSFKPLTYAHVPRHWMTASTPDWWDRRINERRVDCMICWRPTKTAPKASEVESIEDPAEKRKWIKDRKVARRCDKCGIVVCRRCKNEIIKEIGV